MKNVDEEPLRWSFTCTHTHTYKVDGGIGYLSYQSTEVEDFVGSHFTDGRDGFST